VTFIVGPFYFFNLIAEQGRLFELLGFDRKPELFPEFLKVLMFVYLLLFERGDLADMLNITMYFSEKVMQSFLEYPITITATEPARILELAIRGGTIPADKVVAFFLRFGIAYHLRYDIFYGSKRGLEPLFCRAFLANLKLYFFAIYQLSKMDRCFMLTAILA
jgi:hypothetical protein